MAGVPEGTHILTAADLDDMSNPRQRYWLPEFEADPRALNVRHGGAHGAFGTVSASLLAVAEDGVRFEFCPGPPDETGWEAVPLGG
jgi:hypothetical protein